MVGALRDSGLLRAGAPVEVDALELPAGTALRCAEAVARGDASAGWCVSIAITASLLVAYLPPGEDPGPWARSGATWTLTDVGSHPGRARVREVIEAGPPA